MNGNLVIGILCAVTVVTATAFGANKVSTRLVADAEARKAVAAQHEEDRQLCRLLLGYDTLYGASQQKLTMACAQEVIDEQLKRGRDRGDAAGIAWGQCMPDLSPCERALRDAN